MVSYFCISHLHFNLNHPVMKTVKIVLIFVLGISLFSCDKKSDDNKKTETKSESESVKKDQEPVFSKKEFEKSYEGCNPDSSSCTYVNIDYVEMTEGESKDKINAHIMNILLTTMYPMNDTSYGSLEDLANGFIKDYADTKKEFPEIPGEWYLEANLTDTGGTDKIICIEQSFGMFTGGAHPVHYETYFNFDARTGDTLGLSNLFKTGFEKELQRLVVNKFRKDQNLKPDEPLTNAGLFDDSLSYNNNFLLTKEGITFHYNIYEIWSYAQGTTDIFIPYSDLKGILKENGLY